jgi:hypothetical protein
MNLFFAANIALYAMLAVWMLKTTKRKRPVKRPQISKKFSASIAQVQSRRIG